MTGEPDRPVLRQLMLDLGDVDDQLVPRGWRGWRTTITTEAPPRADTGDRKAKPRKPRRQEPVT